MAHKFGAKSLAELKGVHPRLVDVATRALAISAVDFGINDGLRTEAEQRANLAAGVSQTMASKHLVQVDGFGHAIDAVPFVNGKPRWEWAPIYVVAAAFARALAEHNAANPKLPPLRLRWGGCWRDLSTIDPTPMAMDMAVRAYTTRRRQEGKTAFQDGPHFEVLQ